MKLALAGSLTAGVAIGIGAVTVARANDKPGSNAADAFLDFVPTTTAWAAANIGMLGGAVLLSGGPNVGVRAGGAALLTLGAASYAAFATSLISDR